jgi:putative FmdB family regulatory protein
LLYRPSLKSPLNSPLSSHFLRLNHQPLACEHAFEAFQSFSDEPLTICPECKGEVKKVYSAVGVVFKGSGFYKTDSAPKPATPSKSE